MLNYLVLFDERRINWWCYASMFRLRFVFLFLYFAFYIKAAARETQQNPFRPRLFAGK